ncbi:PREDICTED: probable pectinesterase/pectinesterase inhibitor 12 [Nicotiana attenuata]|uniref:Pectinesterase n=1 Tax=Nicotiana attenuata TaxID=49451 RepID=A0A314LA21_NICAT|nr:PREDICTED: probable pectinesterase/pectinesterase inhibitor 12 [Nicotiana attenuata]OIT38428.1 putative pectinesterasepectinesterase inhibitor 12 [Nicotiana attenuata]
MASSFITKFLLLMIMCSTSSILTTFAFNSSSNSSTLNTTHISSLKSLCNSTPYPDSCFNSLKLSISINISPNILNLLLHSLQSALSETRHLTTLFSSAGGLNLVEKQKGIVQDCKELHQITISSIKKSLTRINTVSANNPKILADTKAFLSAALTNKATCLEGLDFTTGPLKSTLINSLSSTYEHVSNSLSMLSKYSVKKQGNTTRRRRLLSTPPRWLSKKDRHILQSDYEPNEEVAFTVAADGTGNFSTITEAIDFAPNNSDDRIFIYVKEGIYQENVEIPSWKTNIVLLGDGSDVTVVTGNRSVVDGWTTFRSATVAVSGEGFLARDITFENTAGPEKHQAVALRINADLAAIYRCTITGFQDTLYAHSFRQFYRECDIYGTVDYIFGNAAVVFQGCNIVSRMPMPGQFTVITAQSRDSPEEYTGISIQNCSILATEDLYSNSSNINSYLGRPWRNYSRTVYLESYIDGFIEPEGWKEWSGNQSLDTLYYGEYDNTGPASVTDNRVTWLGYHIMDYYDASNFTVSEFITGEEWLDSTSFPYDDGV